MARRLGLGLLVAALALVVAAFAVWDRDSDQAERDQSVEEYRAVLMGEAPDDIEPSRTGPIVMGATAAVLFLGGVIALVIPSPDS